MELQDKEEVGAILETAGKGADYTFTTDSVLNLAEILSEIAHKWEELAISLKLSKVERVECGSSSSFTIKLHSVLERWVEKQNSSAVPPTLLSLKKALAGPILNEANLARQLEEKFLKNQIQQISQKNSASICIYDVQYKEILIRRYVDNPAVPHGSWPPVGTKNFINLALVRSASDLSKSDYSVGGNPADALASKETMDYLEAFGKYEKGSTLLVLGCPGSGKTTLVHKVCKDWAKGETLKSAELVYLVSLRMLNVENLDRHLTGILRQYYFRANASEKIVRDLERNNGEGVCFVFDGFDEYNCQNKMDSVVYAMLNKSYLPQAMIIVSSRPAAASLNLDRIPLVKKIQVFGFTRMQTYEYIESFPFSHPLNVTQLNKDSTASNLKIFLESHPSVLDLCYLPVNSAIICFLYENEPGNMPCTQTAIYECFTKSIILRQLIRKDKSLQLSSFEELKGIHADQFKNICELAFNMTTRSQQVISLGTVNTIDTSLGLVTIDVTARLSGFQNTFTFLHLTLQEFLAAYYLSRIPLNEQLKLIEEYSSHIHMISVWRFYFGLVNFEGELERAETIFKNMKKCTNNLPMFRLQCAYESRQDSICELVSAEEFNFLLYFLSISDMYALAYVMSSVAACNVAATTKLILSTSYYDDDKLKTLISQLNREALNCLEELEISGSGITSVNLEALAVQFRDSKLKSLNISGVILDPDKMKALVHVHQFPQYLTCLNLSLSHIGPDSVELLSRALPWTRIEDLDVSDNKIGDHGAEKLAKALVSSNLQKLKISSNRIGVDGAQALASSLAHNTKLLELDLGLNKIGGTGAKAVLDALLCNKTLLKLCLSHNNIGIHGKTAFVVYDQQNLVEPSVDHSPFHLNKEPLRLRELNLGSNLIDVNTASAITNYLLENFNQLQNLNLSWNSIGSDGIVDVCLKLLHHIKLQTLDISHNAEYEFTLTDSATALNLSYNQINCTNAVALAKGIEQLHHLVPPLFHNRSDQTQSLAFSIDFSANAIDKHGAEALLRALKTCDNIVKVDLQNNPIQIDVETLTNLSNVFRHPRLDRYLSLNMSYFEVPSDASECSDTQSTS